MEPRTEATCHSSAFPSTAVPSVSHLLRTQCVLQCSNPTQQHLAGHLAVTCAHQMNAGTCLALQACTADGTVYDITNIVPYVQKLKRHPVSGEPLQLKDVIKLIFHKNNDGEYHCPMLHKVGTMCCCSVTNSCCWKWFVLREACTVRRASA